MVLIHGWTNTSQAEIKGKIILPLILLYDWTTPLDKTDHLILFIFPYIWHFIILGMLKTVFYLWQISTTYTGWQISNAIYWLHYDMRLFLELSATLLCIRSQRWYLWGGNENFLNVIPILNKIKYWVSILLTYTLSG